MQAPRPLPLWIACLLLATGSAGPLHAQTPALDELVLQWALGRYASPLHCEIDGKPVRGLRRLEIAPGPRDARPKVDVLRFLDMEVAEATRCFNELGAPQPNLLGSLKLRYAGTAHRATAMRDFRVALERERGFDFVIASGELEIVPVGVEAQPARRVSFRGGRARLALVREGSDEARLLADLSSPRKALLTIEAPDETRFALPLLLTAPPRARSDRGPR